MLVALLLMANEPEKAQSLDEVIRTIISLSFLGDIRMKLRIEDATKFDRIYQGNLEKFQKIYASLHSQFLSQHLAVN